MTARATSLEVRPCAKALARSIRSASSAPISSCAMIIPVAWWISSPAWDLASFVHHHGFELLAALIEGYARDAEDAQRRTTEATLLAVVIALHRLSRAVAEKDNVRLQWALERLTAATTRARNAIR